MAKEKPDEAPAQPASESARIYSDVFEMLREMCYNAKDTRGRRMKMTQMIDSLLRPVTLKAYKDFKAEQAKKAKPAADE